MCAESIRSCLCVKLRSVRFSGCILLSFFLKLYLRIILDFELISINVSYVFNVTFSISNLKKIKIITAFSASVLQSMFFVSMGIVCVRI